MPELRRYQKDAVSFLHGVPKSALYLDMGLGKTATCLSALTPDHLPALVVAPPRVASEVWPEERDIWRPDLSLRAAAGTPKQRRAALEAKDADITTISRDSIKDLEDYPGKYRTVILDESSGFKTPSSNRFKNARRLWSRPNQVDHLWELTGTPTPGGLLDLWSQIYLLDRGQRLETGITKFRQRYFFPGRIMNGVVTEWTPYDTTPDRIHSLIDDIALSMKAESLLDEMPQNVINPVQVPLEPGILRLYKEMKKELLLDLEMLGGEIHTAANAAVLTSKLSQIAAGFIFSDDGTGAYDILHTAKINALREIIESSHTPVFVAYRFRPELEMIKQAFKSDVHTIDEPGIQKKWNAGDIPILAAHPASAGHGLNLQKGPGHTAVWTSLTWSLEEWQQFNRRLARPGQAKLVTTHVLLAPRTLDAGILATLDAKRDVQDALINHLESPL